MLNESKQIFNITKENTLNLIKKLNKEITCETKEHNSGIYMIYIDDFSDDKIIPIYVGKAVDIQRRYEEHYKEILSLNRLKYNVYSIYNDIGLYDGAFKSCKIFKYMVERNLSLKNYHLIVLELCDKENLEEKEQYYIELLKSEYFGFNQLNAKTLWIPYSIACIKTKDSNFALKYIKCVQENCKNIEKFIDYGFTE
ncbi:MAG: excinuclease ABC subunit C, partial [Clostridia bacterium]|nr:excinuclease ABC subunit C [Clostridia bacterium]